jgi:hypothetical protein
MDDILGTLFVAAFGIACIIGGPVVEILITDALKRWRTKPR